MVIWEVAGLALGALAGMAAQLLLQITGSKHKIRYTLVFSYRHPGVRRVAQLTLPLLMYLALAQTSTIVERMFASTLPSGTVSWLSYAQKITSLPNMLITGSVLVVLFPTLARSTTQDLNLQFREELWRGIRFISFLVLPATVLLWVASEEVVSILYQRGQFTAFDVHLTAVLTMIYAAGIYPTALGITFVRAFHATQDMRTPLWTGILTTLIYIGFAASLSRAKGAVGLAWSLSLAAICSMLMLGALIQRKVHFLRWKAVLDPTLRMAAAALLGGVVYLVLANLFRPDGQPSTSITVLVTLLISLSAAGATYLFACSILNVEPARRYWRAAVVTAKQLVLGRA